ncbi:hypothetical protein [Streptomyces sp. AK02-01A]|uniref:hypothetical protein n=1 Tax=Streptomyces sp. AK02-01A TaxID=3028648 RepID=UPI0029B75DEC|nr:hypothetical protein [Streptomyces sp. AK02-01A]MDX3850900.1 hypothetical protein [Streptomyces sp. AK02-01A]
MAFGADELCVLRRALAVALHPAPLSDEDVRACLRLAESVDEAVREAGRLRAFLLADLGRYREALPGSVTGYLELLHSALDADYLPGPDDLAALRALRGNPAAAALLDRCRGLAERSVRARLTVRASPARLLALVGGRAADDPPPRRREPRKPEEPQEPQEPQRPRGPGRPPRPGPERPMPKPSEVFPPRRRPTPPPERLAAG